MAAKISESPALDAEVRRAGLSFVSAIEERFALRDVFVSARARVAITMNKAISI